MSKFKVGDKVRIKQNSPRYPGCTGTIHDFLFGPPMIKFDVPQKAYGNSMMAAFTIEIEYLEMINKSEPEPDWLDIWESAT